LLDGDVEQLLGLQLSGETFQLVSISA